MTKKFNWTSVTIGVLVIVSGLLIVKTHFMYNDISATKKSVRNLEETVLLQNINNQAQLGVEKVVVDPVASVVYLPEFNIKLPLNNITKTFTYIVRNDALSPAANDGPAEADVSSDRYIAPPKITRINCAGLVRLKLEDKAKPYNPHEKTTSISLANGSTLQVYESVNVPECETSWKNSVSPSTVATEFKNAEVY